MKNLIYITFIFLITISCSEDEYVISIPENPMVGTWEGSVDIAGIPYQTLAIIKNDGTVDWAIFLKSGDLYVEKYHWSSLNWADITNNMDSWHYGKVLQSENRRVVLLEGSIGTFSSDVFGLEMPIGWNPHYSVFDFGIDAKEYHGWNLCVPQSGNTGNEDEECPNWKSFQSGLFFKAIKTKP